MSKNIVCFGDSLVEGEGDFSQLDGWPGRLRALVVPNKGTLGGVAVYNMGISGAPTSQLVARFSEVINRDADVLIIATGTNDIKYYVEDNEHAAAKYQWQKNFDKLISLSKANCKNVLIHGLCLLPEYGKTSSVEIKPDSVVECNSYMKTKCEENNIPFLDIQELVADKLDWQDYFSHGVHWNDKGYDMLSDAIISKLKALSWLKPEEWR